MILLFKTLLFFFQITYELEQSCHFSSATALTSIYFSQQRNHILHKEGRVRVSALSKSAFQKMRSLVTNRMAIKTKSLSVSMLHRAHSHVCVGDMGNK